MINVEPSLSPPTCYNPLVSRSAKVTLVLFVKHGTEDWQGGADRSPASKWTHSPLSCTGIEPNSSRWWRRRRVGWHISVYAPLLSRGVGGLPTDLSILFLASIFSSCGSESSVRHH